MGIFTGAFYESLQQQGYPFVGHCAGRGSLLHEHNPEGILQTSSHYKKDWNKGSRIAAIWTAFFSAQASEEKGISGRSAVDCGFLGLVINPHLGH